ncbi:unnamed protein product [Peronospora destructor]|uniref:Reverse transcriptase Ty1/copia-type domain-containing protein n=1 Tax=Peronospora destructor TaxID=86335 RepID=A0AAV0UQE5_9STRA|nr:unnamed protein product [Peronospora destructor]
MGNRYLVNFVDHKSNYCRVFLARTKDQAAKKFEHFLAFFEKRFNCQVHVLRTDGGGEYKNMDLLCKSAGVARQVSEARNQRPMSYKLEPQPCVANGPARHRCVWINVYGVPRPEEGFVRTSSALGTTVERSDETKGNRVYIRKDNIVIVMQHIKNIQTFPDTQNGQVQLNPRPEDHDDDFRGDARIAHGNRCDSDKKKKSKGRGKRWTRAPHATRGATKRSMVKTMPATNYVVTALQVHEPDPKTHAEVMSSSKAEGWSKAMLEKIQALEDNDVFKRPAAANLLHSKWVYKTKTDANGAVERLKARLVACGNEQVVGIDYSLTFAAVMEMSTMKVILGLAATWGVPAKRGDIPNAYVKAGKEEHLEILLHVPSGMQIKDERLKALGVDSASDVALE